MTFSSKKHLPYLIVLLIPLLLLTVGFSLYSVSEISFNRGLDTISKRGGNTLELYVTYLKGMLGKYESLPELFANDELLVNSLLNPGGRKRTEELNRYLETINNISDTSDTYLMDSDGLTIAASNWQEKRPFVGRNFSYRPYFKEAMSGVLGRYFALGTTSSRRGYYFAYPVRKNGVILGAVVVKVEIDSAEEKWGHLEQELLVTDPDGVVFITTNPAWRFKMFGEFDKDVKSRIEKSRRYPVSSLADLGSETLEHTPYGNTISIYDSNNGQMVEYLEQKRKMEHAGWDVKILSNLKAIKRKTNKVILYTFAAEIFAVLLMLLMIQRQVRLTQLKKYEKQTRLMLQESNEKLESRVLARTTELTESNKRLKREITDRIKTEEALQQTREELVHAAKLAALGQMSAGINHELNQPLAAIRSYADNASQFLEKERFEDTRWNLEQIAELTERMGKVVAQLKLFSRKSSGKIERVPLHGVIDGALEILKPVVRKLDVNILVSLEPESVEVMANNVLLQQVFVNLINNAVQAVELLNMPEISIKSSKQSKRVHIRVEDNGSGITADKLPHIFEPFFTTKLSGQGLGLGLTITDRILKEIGGEIFVASSQAGTTFEVILKEAK